MRRTLTDAAGRQLDRARRNRSLRGPAGWSSWSPTPGTSPADRSADRKRAILVRVPSGAICSEPSVSCVTGRGGAVRKRDGGILGRTGTSAVDPILGGLAAAVLEAHRPSVRQSRCGRALDAASGVGVPDQPAVRVIVELVAMLARAWSTAAAGRRGIRRSSSSHHQDP